jgi:hypothetical protein
MATADHTERLGAVECGGARHQSHGLFAGIDDVRVDLVLGGIGALNRVSVNLASIHKRHTIPRIPFSD